MGNILHKLAKKILRGSATKAEQHFMDAYFDAFDHVKGREDALTPEEQSTLRNHIEQGIQERLQGRNINRFRVWLPYAAAVVLAVLGGIWFFFSGDQQELRTDPILAAEEVLPGGHRATLTLADGRVIDLSETQTGITVGDVITYLDGSYVVEKRKKNQGQNNLTGTGKGNLTTDYYVLTTPRGGTYQITLPDGTEVWLNAASKLKYPSRFDESERVVEVSGEAYFAVAEDKSKPFKVNSHGQTVEILGTEFNISAYPAEDETKTTLVEGAIRLINHASNAVNRLRPGEQAVVSGAMLNISKVNVEPYTVWKEGYFYFDNVPPEVAIEQVARWYDLEVVYEGNMPGTSVFGMVERTKRLDAVLKSLGKSGLDFEIRQRGSKTQLIVRGK